MALSHSAFQPKLSCNVLICTWMLLLTCGWSSVVTGQSNNFGIPFTTNYFKQDYGAATQNWDIAQSAEGLLYVANNSGVLEFDGHSWRLLPLTSNKQVRSLALSPEGRLYAGGQGEAGYFEANVQGVLQYVSLLPLIPEEHRVFDEVWRIIAPGDKALFFASGKLYECDGEQCTVNTSLDEVMYLGLVNERIVVQDRKRGLLFLNGEELIPIPGIEPDSLGSISEVLPDDQGGFYALTLRNGIFHYDGNTLSRYESAYDAFFRDNTIYCGTILADGELALGTSQGGLVILHPDGRAWYHITKKEGLQNNNILSLFRDRSDNLWLGLDNGIDYLEISSPLRKFFPDNELQGTGYACRIFNDKIWFGTNNGLYCRDWKPYYDPFADNSFRLVEGSRGQIWRVDEVHGKLLVAGHEGAYELIDSRLEPIDGPPTGTWLFQSLDPSANRVLVGSYGGLGIVDSSGQHWESLSGLEESSRFVERADKKRFWVAHPNRGAWMVELDNSLSAIEKVRLYNEQNGFPSNFFIHCFTIRDEVLFTGENGIYRFNEAEDGFVHDTDFEAWFDPGTRIRRLVEEPDGPVWYATDRGVGFLAITDQGLKREVTNRQVPVSSAELVDGFEFIYPVDAHNTFIGLESGFVRVDQTRLDATSSLPDPILRSVVIPGSPDSVLYGGTGTLGSLTLPQQRNHLQLTFALPHFSRQGAPQFRSKLDGFDMQWSSWSNDTEMEYTNLPAGAYKLMVQARQSDAQTDEVTLFRIQIMPPWYATLWAFLGYGLTASIILGAFILIPRRQHQKETAQIRQEVEQSMQQKDAEHQEVMARSEDENRQLRNDKLRAEVNFKTKELASTTMHLVQKSEILQTIREELNTLSEGVKDPDNNKKLRQLVRKIDGDIKLDRNWKQFEHNFDQVHVDFLKKVKERYPQLTPKDIRLCAYLRMNLSTKEMAPLLNISIRGVEISRYRLRKKLGLDGEKNLVEFISEIE